MCYCYILAESVEYEGREYSYINSAQFCCQMKIIKYI